MDAEHCDPKAMYQRPLYHIALDHRWDHVDGVTILGDAAHLMSPFAGEGANLALYDGAELARELAAHPDAETAFAAYERRLFPRSGEIAARSARNLETLFGQGAPGSVVSLFARY